MDSKEFKKVFGEIAKTYGFESVFGGWLKESSETIVVLDLQKSNFGNHYELNIKIYIQGMFGNNYTKSKNLIKKHIGNIFRRQPPDFNDVLNFDSLMDEGKRMERLGKLFTEFLAPFADNALSKAGIRYLAEKGEISLLPAIKKEIA